MSAVLDAGADDMKDDGDAWEILSAPESASGRCGGGEGARHRAGVRRDLRCCRPTT